MIQLSSRIDQIWRRRSSRLEILVLVQASDPKIETRATRISTKVRCLTALLTLALAPVARSTVITFDDLSPRPSDRIPLNYHGLLFSGSPYNGITQSSTSVIPGVQNGVVSNPNVLLSEGQALSIQPFNFEYGTLFTFNGGYFTSAYDNTLTVEAIGFTTGVPLRKALTLTNERPTFVSFDWRNLSEIEFQGLPAGIGSNTQFVIDNLTVNENAPEPQAILLLGVGLVLISLKRWKSRSKVDLPPKSAHLRLQRFSHASVL